MNLLKVFIKQYPRQSFLVIFCLVLSSLAEGLSISFVIPLLAAVENDQTDMPTDKLSEYSFFRYLLELQPSVNYLLLFIVLGIIIKSILVLFAKRQIGNTTAQIATDLRLQLLNAVMSSRWRYFTAQPIGGITNAMVTEASRASEAYISGMRVISFGLISLVYIALVFTISWQTTLIICGLVILVWFVLNIFIKMARSAGRSQTKIYTSLSSRLTDILRSVKPLKAMAKQGAINSVLIVETKKLNLALRLEVLSITILEALQEPLFTLVLVVSIFVSTQIFGQSFVIALIMVFFLLRVLLCISKVQHEIQNMNLCESAYTAIKNRIQEAEKVKESWNGSHLPKLKKDIVFRNVDFSYADRSILKNFSLQINACELTALAGVSGAGKTTVIDLLIGLHRPDRGQILIDGVDLGDIDLHAWRHKIGYVPQENLLMHDTILQNLTLGDSSITAEDIEFALEASGVTTFLEELPEGLDTIAGEQGLILSGGQRQRIMIARSLVHRPDLLILDEATSNLDAINEGKILQTLLKLRGSITILAVSHQPLLNEVADRVCKISPN